MGIGCTYGRGVRIRGGRNNIWKKCI